jgi:NADPH:quinone reductase-like Zn-dependent oxidoreductase
VHQRGIVKAIVQDAYGSPDVLELREIDQPVAGDDEVLVQVHAAGIDQGVWHIMAGLPYLIRLAGYGIRAPKNPVPGADLAGVVEAVGKGVTRFQPGDQVFGIGRGSFASKRAPARTSSRRSRRTSASSRQQRSPSPLTRPAGLTRPRESASAPEGVDHRCIGRRGDVRRAAGQGTEG